MSFANADAPGRPRPSVPPIDQSTRLSMSIRTKDAALKAILASIAAVVVALALLTPGVLAYKLAHGASGLSCAAILTGYAASWAVLAYLLARFGERSAMSGILFGFCFYGLWFLSWRL